MAALFTTCHGNNVFLCEVQGLPRGGKASPQNTTGHCQADYKAATWPLGGAKFVSGEEGFGLFPGLKKIGPVGPIGHSCLSFMRNC